MLDEGLDGLLLATVHVYISASLPVSVTCRVWVSVISIQSLVQVTVVAGPPVEIQVRVFMDNFTPPTMYTDVSYIYSYTSIKIIS